MTSSRLRVCYFGTYHAEYSRNQIMIESLRRNGVDVVECHTVLWGSIEDRVDLASGRWAQPGFWARVVRAYIGLLKRYSGIGPYDVLLVGYPGQFDVFLARLLSWFSRKPLVWDIFMSIYLIALERGLDRKSILTVNALSWLEWLACRIPDLLIIDTDDYAMWFGQIHGVKRERFRLVPTGADNRTFSPQESMRSESNQFRAVYYGTFIPNHGVPYIIEAARLLADDPTIHIDLIGRGPDREPAMRLAQHHGLTNVTFVDWLEQTELVKRVAHCDVCLGVFGQTPQSLMTVQNKIYEGLALGKPVITGRSPIVERTFQHGQHLYLCERANPQSLAEAIRTLYTQPKLRQHLAREGQAYFQKHFTLEALGQIARAHLHEVAEKR